jgi:predicted nucleotidyltransferase
MKKPSKKHYEDQNDAFEKFKQFILPRLEGLKGVKEARVWGSLARGEFGLYSKEYLGQAGSDVDLIVLLEEGARMPTSWKRMLEKTWFDGYYDRSQNKRYRKFEYGGTIHKVDLLVVKNSEILRARERLNGETKGVYLKKGSKGELK